MRIGTLAFTTSLLLFAASATAGEVRALGFADPATAVADRQAAMKSAGGMVQKLKGAVDSGGDVKEQAALADQLAAFAKSVPSLFPEGTAEGSKAKPEVWSDRAGFEAKAAVFADATAKLAEAAKAGDTAGFATQFGEVRKSCGGCHSSYKQPGM